MPIHKKSNPYDMNPILLLTLLPIVQLWGADASFTASKRLLKTVYEEHQRTFYCDCSYSYENKGNMIDRDSCGYLPRNPKTKKGKENQRARRIEWEHVMPAENFGRHLPCWKEGGRQHCREVSATFREMEADMMNLVPAVGELNALAELKKDFECSKPFDTLCLNFSWKPIYPPCLNIVENTDIDKFFHKKAHRRSNSDDIISASMIP